MAHLRLLRGFAAAVGAAAAMAMPVAAQQRSSAGSGQAAAAPRAMTAADYARAEKFMTYNTTPLVYRSGVRPTWLADGRFWYRVTTPAGSEAILVDPATGTKAPCDLPACAETAGGRSGRGAGGGRGAAGAAASSVASPDGTRAVFIRDWNLWVRDVPSGKETPLTTDGAKDFGYATDNAGWSRSDRPIVLWSPDSRKVATFQQDQRKVGEMYLVNTQVGHPELQAWKYPLPGDADVAMIHRVVIDVNGARVIRFKMDPDQHRSTLCDNLACRGDWSDVQWNPDGSTLAFVSTSRDHRKTQLRLADASTGAVREVLEETVPTFFESGNGRINWKYLPASNEVIWFSERDNWGQLYLYDLQTGKLKQQITTGEGNVTQLLRVDEKDRVLIFQGVGREKGRDPYFTHLYRVGIDGRNAALLTPEDATHEISLADSGKYFVDSYSKPDVAPVAVLRDTAGRLILTLEKADISKLVATGWQPPMPITMKARDGQTDIHGLMYRPSNLDTSKKYPIINQIYPGPQTGSVGSRTFSPARGDTQALAELGFIVVQIDGMGTPWRSKKFHEAYYGDMGDNTLPDQIAGMKQLAQKYPYIDLTRVGIWGHSGGGYATAGAMFHYPDFFHVGISESGNHDNRVYEDDWAEKWSGLLEKKADGTSNYDSQANQNFAKNLKGKLLLAHGTMDANVPPNSTLLVVEALIKANKDFDLLLFPNAGHGYGAAGNYMIRRRWDYFVKHLLGMEPPKGYELKPPAPRIQSPPAPPLREETFTMKAAGEAVGTITASCRDCDWGVKGREAAVLILTVDGEYSQHLILTRGATTAPYDVMLGSRAAGTHRLRITTDPARSAPSAGAATVSHVSVRTFAAGTPEHAWLARAPMIHARPGTLEQFSDLPLLMWVEETSSAAGRGYDYSVIFTHEDGGTPTDRLMATWGRTTDIELMYSADLTVAPSAGGGTYQGKDHEVLPFRGRIIGTHPLLWVSTTNNMVSDQGAETVRFAPAPRLFPLVDVSREAVMDAQPWTYAVMAAELAREGRIREDAQPGSAQVRDPRRFAYLEGCADMKDATFAFDVGVTSAAGAVQWHATDRGEPRFRLARTGCFRAALPLPRGTVASQIRGVRLRAYTRPPRQEETPLPAGSGTVTLRRINTVFMLDEKYVPGPPALTWTGRIEAQGNGEATTLPPGELRIR